MTDPREFRIHCDYNVPHANLNAVTDRAITSSVTPALGNTNEENLLIVTFKMSIFLQSSGL